MDQRFSSIVVDLEKLRDYCLSETHPRGRHNARVFRSRLGLSAQDASLLRDAMLAAAQDRPDLRLSTSDGFGQRYVWDIPITTAVGHAVVRSAWIVITGTNVLRLTSCYVL
ncbi:DUF6883 domain-containing protein [uncultured Enterovirga sp.]|uniref:DUF6883 domain-containing protein n=1 Tax=uncultured Enterovirga sp. TaxID=2026352 RepID=UPI0035CC2AAA